MLPRDLHSDSAPGFVAKNLATFNAQSENKKAESESKAESENNIDLTFLQPFYVPPRDALVPGPGNVDMRTIISGDKTGKQISNVEVCVAPMQMGPSPHVHKDLDELMYVVEGTATVMIGDAIYEVEAGGWNFRPRGIVHSFWNASEKPLRFVDCFFNQNFEVYLETLFHQIIPEMVSKNLTPGSPEIARQIAALDQRFGVTWFHERRQEIVERYQLRN